MVELSLIIPTFNEAENIALVIPKVISKLQHNNINFEIIIVDDNSPDLTWKIAKELFINDSRVKVIRRFGSKDLSTAVLTGMGNANGKYLGVMDADCQHDESILPEMLAAIKENDIVVGSRLVENGSYGGFKASRKLISQGATWMAKKILNVKISDPMSGFFIISRDIFENTASRINPRGFKILLEFISINSNLRIKEIGFTFKERMHGQTKLSAYVMQHFILSLFDLWFGNYFSLRFVKYSIVGLSGIVVNLFGQWIGQELFQWKLNANAGYLVPSFAIALGFELSVFSNYFLNNRWTFYESTKKGLAHIAGILKFNLVSLAGFLIQISVWRFLLGYFSQFFPDFFPSAITYICNFAGIISATIWNYYLNRNLTWAIKGD